MAIQRKWDTTAIELVGDSVTALSWTAEGRFRSDRVINAATVFAMMCAMHDVHIVRTGLVSSEANWMCDMQSRRPEEKSWEELMTDMKSVDKDFVPFGEIHIEWLDELLQMCDPRKEFASEEDFGEFWRRVHEWVTRL